MVIQWNRIADVVVVGYGFAGAVSAITAHDLGASVILLEKQQRPGGLSIFAGGGFRFADNAESAFKYLRRTCLNTVPDDVLKSASVGFTEVVEFLKQLEGGAGLPYIERRNTGGTYPFEGGQTFGYFKPRLDPKFEKYPWLHSHGSGWVIFKLLENEIRKREIEVMMNTKLTGLVRNEAGMLIGCVAQRSSEEICVKARKGVILACGGFEQNEDMKIQFFQGQPIYSDCPSANEGDGIRVAQLFGAKLWHMWHIHGSYGFKHPELQVALRHRFGGGTKDNEARKFPWIIIDKFGMRYMNEQPHAPQDTPWRDMMAYDPDIQDYPRIPSYMIFNDVAKKAGPLFVSHYTDMDPISARYEWSEDNSEEIEKGWIKKGGSIEELASLIQVSAETLVQTLGQWNTACKTGEKDPFRRPRESMAAIDYPPFYAVPVWPIVTNTQGGVAHSPAQNVLDAMDKPIPRLYVAGQVSSIFGHLYLQAGNASEAIFTGKFAANNAVKESMIE